MKAKKTEKANLEKQRPTLMLIGLAIAISLTLESFEWESYDYATPELASVLSEEFNEEILEEVRLEIPKKSQPKVLERKDKEFVKVTEEKKITVIKPILKKELPYLPEIDPYDLGIDDGDDGGFVIEGNDDPYVIVEEMPEFPGGIKALYSFIGERMKYPSISAENGSQGQALINFTIEKDGSITDVKSVGGSADKFCQNEAIRVVESMPNWKPGKQRGRKVRVSYTIPVRFRLNG